jgi:hypothetical protein
VGRKPKYRNENERRAAARAANKRYYDKHRKKPKAKGRIPTLAATMEEALKMPAAGSASATTARSSASDLEALPAVDIPMDAASSPMDAPTDDAGIDSASSAEQPSPESSATTTSDSASSTEAPKETIADTIAGEKLAKMGAAAWCQVLTIGSGYAESVGALGIPQMVVDANFEAMEYLLTDALKESNIDKKKYAAYVCVGSGAWVGGNCYYGYYKVKQAEAKAAKEKGVVIDARGQTTRSQPVNGTGAAAPPAAPEAAAAAAATAGGAGPGSERPKSRDYV